MAIAISSNKQSKTKWKHGLSIIVPTLNEYENVQTLFNRIEESLSGSRLFTSLPHEIIIVDDHSDDDTVEVSHERAKEQPIRVIMKKGEPGKAYSLIEGFESAHYDIVCIIDADLQYPPEAIPDMVKRIVEHHADLVVANRHYLHDTPFPRRVISKVNKLLNRVIHGTGLDTQSGLKVFRHDLLNHFELHPTGWTLDMYLIAYAKVLGCKIDTVDISFAKRTAGVSKVKVFSTSLEVLRQSLKLRFRPIKYLPFNAELNEEYGQGFFYKGSAYISHSSVKRNESAIERLIFTQALILIAALILIVLGLFLEWHTVITLLMALLTLLYFTDLLFNLFLIYRSFSRTPELKTSKAELRATPDKEWPKYTILCPLYKEQAVLPQFTRALARLDYDFDKLQVLLLLEEDDTETITVARRMKLPDYFEIVIVPPSYPKTKPKACNYGLKIATGDYVVIFDAEDVPNPQQLKQAYLAFKNSPDNVVCIQGKLNFYNPRQNILTRAFTAEYSLWFDLVLTGLQSINAPIPLGGTSNHFKAEKLRELGGWDAFNVTEDADLGIRLARRGYRTAIIDAVTLEEANSNLKNWFWQRTRWIKGYMQTYLVHSRHLRDFPSGWQRLHAITFQFVIGGKVLSLFLNPLMWALTICYFTLRAIVGPTIESFFPAPVLYLAVFSLIFGNFLYLYYYMIGCAKREHYDLIKYAFLIPFYWLAMSVAAWVAFAELIYKPHHWSKTKHGLHLNTGEEAIV